MKGLNESENNTASVVLLIFILITVRYGFRACIGKPFISNNTILVKTEIKFKIAKKIAELLHYPRSKSASF